MTARRSFDHLLTEWLDEGPSTAPREDLAALLQAIPDVRQRRRVGREIQMPTIMRLAVAAAIVVVLGGLAFSRVFGPSNQVGAVPTPSPTPTATPQPTPGWADRFPAVSSTSFRHPFTYAIDPASGIAAGSADDVSQVFDVVDPATNEQNGRVVLKVVAGVREDVCHSSGGAVINGPTPRELADYLEQLPGNQVTEGPPATVDGRPAIVVDLTQLPVSSRPCKDEYVWTDGNVPFTDIGDGYTRRIVAFDVGGETIVAIIMAPEAAMPAFVDTASAFLDSVRFSGSASPEPSTP